MTDYHVTHWSDAYEVGETGNLIIAACRCGDGDTWLNKGLGRAFAAAWRTRHQECGK